MKADEWASDLEMRERESCIEHARKPLQQGNGICVDCIEAVEPERSNSLRCISCEQDEEHRQRTRYGHRHG